VRGLHNLRQLRGPVAFDPRVRELIGGWSVSKQKEILGSEHEAVLGAFWSRLETTCLKLALIYELSREPERKPEMIGSQSVGEAINTVEALYGSLLKLLGRELSGSPAVTKKNKLLALIEKKPGITRREMLQRSHLLSKDFQPIFETLMQEGSVETRKGGLYLSQVSQGVADAVLRG
jgi:hypothetical protein